MKIPKELKWRATGKTLGQGGQGTVVEVTDSTQDDATPCALKALAKNRPRSAYERFVNEIEVIKQLNHPSIIQIIDHSEPDADFHYYVMELVSDARSLKKYLNSNKNPYFQNSLKSLKLFEQIVEVIKACGEIGIVHRDLSPSNILTHSEDSIKIIDFGLCQIDNSQTITLIDEGVGTQNYMAPECESGAEGKITSMSDLYSAGKLLWSAISNQNAFSREAPVFDLKSMKSIFPDLPDTWHLHHIFEKTIRVDPEDRWENADEALEVCKKVQNLITGNYQPLELIKTVCPLCGLGNPEPFSMSRMVFENNPDIQTFQCSYCGYMFSLNYRTGVETLNKRKELD